MPCAKPFPQKFQYPTIGTSCTSIAILAIFVSLYTILYSHGCSQYFGPFNPIQLIKWSSSPDNPIGFATNVSHIKFILASSKRTLKSRKGYIESWWKPNQTRGNMFLDSPPPQDFLPWPSSYPPFQVSEDIKKLKVYPQLAVPYVARLFRLILETFRLGDDQGVRWYVMGDDDTVFLVQNLVDVLGKYDHTKHYYIGMSSEAVTASFEFAFDMAYGGGGYALSYSLVEALVPVIDDCIERYAHLIVSDQMLASCLADLGVDLTREKGFHQMDIKGDVSGLLSSHPQAPLVSLHHLDGIKPFFPGKNRSDSINQLMKAGEFGQSRLLQQTICYHRPTNWSFSVSWGYSAHVYETIIPRSLLRKPLETFRPYRIYATPPYYMFNTRERSKDPSCDAPHVFFLDSAESTIGNNQGGDDLVVTVYNRSSRRKLPPCSATGNHSADHITNIRVVVQATSRKQEAKVECCDVEYVGGANVAEIKLRPCISGEVIA